MKAFDIPTHCLTTIAEDMGIRIEGDNSSFVLRPVSGSDRWRKTRNGRRINAISWDGHYIFLHRVFSVFPQGRIKSCLADYRGLNDFLEKAPNTRNNWSDPQ